MTTTLTERTRRSKGPAKAKPQETAGNQGRGLRRTNGDVTERGFVLIGHWVKIKPGILHKNRVGRVVNVLDRGRILLVEIAGNTGVDGSQNKTAYLTREVQPYLGEEGELSQLVTRVARLRVLADRQDFSDEHRGAIAARAERLFWRLRLLQREQSAEWRQKLGSSFKHTTAMIVVNAGGAQ